MSTRNSTSNGKNSQVIMMKEMIRRFERLFGDIGDKIDKQEGWMKRQDILLANLRREQPRDVSNAKRQCRWDSRADIGGENEAGDENDDDALVEAEIGKMRNRGDRHDRRVRDCVGDGVDRNMGNIVLQIFDNIINRDIPWPKVPDELSYEAYDLMDKLLIENPVQRLGATGAGEVKRHQFFKDINWDTLARQKAAFIPSADLQDTSYFMSRYIWNPEEENVHGRSDFDDMTETGSASCSGSSYSNMQDEEGDECGNLAEFGPPARNTTYSFSNFSFKNLTQLASINYDLVIRSAKESAESTKPSIPLQNF